MRISDWSSDVCSSDLLQQVIDADAAIYHTVKQIIIASLHGHPQPLVIEAARSGIAHSNQPGFAEVFDGLRGRRGMLFLLDSRTGPLPHPRSDRSRLGTEWVSKGRSWGAAVQ